MFVLIYSNQHDNAERNKARRHHLLIGIIKNYNVIINAKSLYDQSIDSDVSRYKKNKKVNNRSRRRLYYRMFVGLWLHQKSLQANSSFEQTKRIRCWSKSSSTNRIGINHIYKNKLDKAYFVNDAAYSDNKYLAKRTISDKILKDSL